MRDNRDKWIFYDHPSKPPLTAKDVRYWKNIVTKLLKVGVELEFNLPKQRGVCRGDDAHCPCVKIDTGCWKKCINTKACESTPCFDTCENRTVTCTADKCASCKAYRLRCLSTNCIEFVSACFTCTKFSRDCNTCPKKYVQQNDPSFIRKDLTKQLQPSNSYGKVSKSGVVSITTDGSLSGDKGVEVITVGRRPDYWEFYNMTEKILTMCAKKGAYLNERCSSHMHLLTSYYNESDSGINELERDMPEIIAANFHQLCRRYQNAITWMTMALDNPNHMTRWEKFRISILEISPVTRSMKDVCLTISNKSKKLSNKDKYGWANYSRMQFSGNDITKFHVEMRVADSTLCPSYYAAIACLFYSLVVKAVEISRYGVLKIGDEEWLKSASKIKDSILNGVGGYDSERFGNTRHALDNREVLSSQGLEMINQLKNTLIKLGPAYDVLYKLAQQPVALRRINGDKWADIEDALSVKMEEHDKIGLRINEIIDLRHIEECATIDEWILEVSKIINDVKDNDIKITDVDIKNFVDNKMRDGELMWSESIGTLMSL